MGGGYSKLKEEFDYKSLLVEVYEAASLRAAEAAIEKCCEYDKFKTDDKDLIKATLLCAVLVNMDLREKGDEAKQVLKRKISFFAEGIELNQVRELCKSNIDGRVICDILESNVIGNPLDFVRFNMGKKFLTEELKQSKNLSSEFQFAKDVAIILFEKGYKPGAPSNDEWVKVSDPLKKIPIELFLTKCRYDFERQKSTESNDEPTLNTNPQVTSLSKVVVKSPEIGGSK